jgi:heme oxygenase
MRASSRRFALRNATSEIHERLDRAVGDFQGLPGYAAYLRGLIGFRGPMEAGLAAVAWPSHWAWRPTLIGADLAADAADLRLPPRLEQSPPDLPQGPSALIGMLYVLEGAILGSRLLCKRAERLGLDARFGARHLAAMAGSGENWRGFLAHLDSSPDYDPEAAARSASSAFAFALHSFESEQRVAA